MDTLQHLQIEKKMKNFHLADARNRTQDQNFTKRSQHNKIKKIKKKVFFSTLPTPGIEPTTKHFKADAKMT